MAHNLYQNKMAFTGEQPWHKLGTEFDAPFMAAEAIEAAGLTYQVRKEQLYRLNSLVVDGEAIPQDQVVEGVGDYEKVRTYATINSDTNKVLGFVGERYHPLQNAEAFSFFDEIVKDGQARYATAGAIGDGERLWILAQVPRLFEVLPGDTVEDFILLTNSHDGSAGVECRFTPIRVVCQNTVNAAVNSSRSVFNIRHTLGVRARLGLAAQIIRADAEHFLKMGEAWDRMVNRRFTEQELFDVMNELLGDPMDVPAGAVRTKRQSKHEQFQALLDSGLGVEIEGVKGSAWGLYNAAVEMADYHMKLRGDGDKTNSLFWGSLGEFKQKAFDMSMALVKA